MGKTQLGKLLGRDEERVQAQKIANFVTFAILDFFKNMTNTFFGPSKTK